MASQRLLRGCSLPVVPSGPGEEQPWDSVPLASLSPLLYLVSAQPLARQHVRLMYHLLQPVS